jgi:hypothetical protein
LLPKIYIDYTYSSDTKINNKGGGKMVCYTVPLVAAIAHVIMRRNISSWKQSTDHVWLSLLLGGGAIFGLVDHWWNGELFYMGKNIVMDISLGVTITVAIFITWAIVVMLNKSKLNKLVKQSN